MLNTFSDFQSIKLFYQLSRDSHPTLLSHDGPLHLETFEFEIIDPLVFVASYNVKYSNKSVGNYNRSHWGKRVAEKFISSNSHTPPNTTLP